MINHASYRILSDGAGEPLLIRDVGPWDQHPTVTNDAEAVVAKLAAAGLLPEGRRLLYFDSEGRLDEILVARGRFAGFKPGDWAVAQPTGS